VPPRVGDRGTEDEVEYASLGSAAIVGIWSTSKRLATGFCQGCKNHIEEPAALLVLWFRRSIPRRTVDELNDYYARVSALPIVSPDLTAA